MSIRIRIYWYSYSAFKFIYILKGWREPSCLSTAIAVWNAKVLDYKTDSSRTNIPGVMFFL